MAGERIERRLAAVLAADVAGYSRLMGADEVGTLQALKAHRRELIDPSIEAFKGRIVKTAGDGMLVEFSSAVDAVTCAMDVQAKMLERNASAAQRSSSASASTSVTSSSTAGTSLAMASTSLPVLRTSANRAGSISPMMLFGTSTEDAVCLRGYGREIAEEY